MKYKIVTYIFGFWNTTRYFPGNRKKGKKWHTFNKIWIIIIYFEKYSNGSNELYKILMNYN